MKIELTFKLDREQEEFLTIFIRSIVEKEIQRQLKFKRNEVLRDGDL